MTTGTGSERPAGTTAGGLRQSALGDPVTGLEHRAVLEGRLEHALAQERPPGTVIAVVVVGLEAGPRGPDGLPARVPDAVLRDCAVRVRRAVRRGDVVCRYGASQIGVLCAGADDEDAVLATAHRLLDALPQVAALGTGDAPLVRSAGVAFAVRRFERWQDLLDRAEAAERAARARDGGLVLDRPPRTGEASRGRG